MLISLGVNMHSRRKKKIEQTQRQHSIFLSLVRSLCQTVARVLMCSNERWIVFILRDSFISLWFALSQKKNEISLLFFVVFFRFSVLAACERKQHISAMTSTWTGPVWPYEKCHRRYNCCQTVSICLRINRLAHKALWRICTV